MMDDLGRKPENKMDDEFDNSFVPARNAAVDLRPLSKSIAKSYAIGSATEFLNTLSSLITNSKYRSEEVLATAGIFLLSVGANGEAEGDKVDELLHGQCTIAKIRSKLSATGLLEHDWSWVHSAGLVWFQEKVATTSQFQEDWSAIQ